MQGQEITINDALKVLAELEKKGAEEYTSELIETAGCWKDGSVDGVLVYDTELERLEVVQEGSSTWTPSFVYLYRVSGNELVDINEELLWSDLYEMDFQEILKKKIILESREEAIGFDELARLLYIKLPNPSYEGVSEEIKEILEDIESWGIGDISDPEREITREDLIRIYKITEEIRSDRYAQREEAILLQKAEEEEARLDAECDY